MPSSIPPRKVLTSLEVGGGMHWCGHRRCVEQVRRAACIAQGIDYTEDR